VGTARVRLTCPLNSRERALLQQAREQVSRLLTEGVTPEQVAEARSALDALNLPRQPSLAFPPSR
jgi:hypothetical protein